MKDQLYEMFLQMKSDVTRLLVFVLTAIFSLGGIVCLFLGSRTGAIIACVSAVLLLILLWRSRRIRDQEGKVIGICVVAFILVVVSLFQLLFVYGFQDMRIRNNVLKACFVNTETVEIPDGVVSIDDYVFGGMIGTRGKDIQCIIVPDSVRHIGDYAFGRCPSLREVYLSANIESIGAGAFAHCPALKTIYFDGTREQWDAIEKGNWLAEWDWLMADCEIIFLQE